MENAVELYLIRDLLAEENGPVFQSKNEAVAVRQFKQIMKDVSDPTEYALYRVGYITKDAEIIPELHIIVEKFKGE